MSDLLKNLSKDIDEKEIELAQLKQDFAEKLCPYKVGDIGYINGYSHHGKKAVIRKIVYKRGYIPKHTYEAFIDIFKKDGTIGQHSSSFWKDSDFQLINE